MVNKKELIFFFSFWLIILASPLMVLAQESLPTASSTAIISYSTSHVSTSTIWSWFSPLGKLNAFSLINEGREITSFLNREWQKILAGQIKGYTEVMIPNLRMVIGRLEVQADRATISLGKLKGRSSDYKTLTTELSRAKSQIEYAASQLNQLDQLAQTAKTATTSTPNQLVVKKMARSVIIDIRRAYRLMNAVNREINLAEKNLSA